MTGTDVTSRPTVLVTGPTRGLGRALVDALLAHPAHPTLVLAGRSAAALAEVAATARAAGAAAWEVVVDLSDLESVARAGAEVRDAVATGALRPLDAVVANAGLQHGDRTRRSAQGHEETFAVNVLAQHALLRELRPALATGGHVVLLGSSTHRGRWAAFGLVPSPRWRDPVELAAPDPSPAGRREVAGGRAYADSKLALVTLAHRWARELAGEQRLNVHDPGLVPGTGLGRAMPAYKRWTWEHVMPAMRVLPGAASPATSARHCAELALGDTHADLHGGYVELGRLRRPAAQTLDRARQERLWDVCEQLVDQATASRATTRDG